jgi:hypothetical protein
VGWVKRSARYQRFDLLTALQVNKRRSDLL